MVGGTLPPIGGRVFLTRHLDNSSSLDNSVSVYLFVEFEPYLGKSEKWNNQRIKKIKLLEFLL